MPPATASTFDVVQSSTGSLPSGAAASRKYWCSMPAQRTSFERVWLSVFRSFSDSCLTFPSA